MPLLLVAGGGGEESPSRHEENIFGSNFFVFQGVVREQKVMAGDGGGKEDVGEWAPTDQMHRPFFFLYLLFFENKKALSNKIMIVARNERILPYKLLSLFSSRSTSVPKRIWSWW